MLWAPTATVVAVIALGYDVYLPLVATVVVGCDCDLPHAGTAISIALWNLRFAEDFDCLLAEGGVLVALVGAVEFGQLPPRLPKNLGVART